ncbi:putrescine-ornithine antiporter [Photobacterium carnosum]|uniref:Putrescine transporter PotE n=1 Tax=Photobacterium carnosum TaxID=2023717 RepID=A0A2N4UX76_9GAMM|nr:putrescine-ornithine antiporter [Photobacterium carnosum]MCD9494040.1 putrescine-ornithine antiporter [Photobacterium carnosum]MCD9497469.1 putrescine-ornithine antiporter [Photobacterium carnosum]MCD9515291.1 putrescine-ornithine antiporter [Photobacterium carnosum]MCD9521307.1 putrescine-ornithine antiporter [Photobacterium carnosum]MCD9528810.1 putrescine-ornithine antiporter [Photobacterium carnosum]
MSSNNNKMGLMGLTTIVTVNMMGSGIILLPSSLAATGGIALLAWVVTAIGALAIAYAFAKCGMYCTDDGGMSAYAEKAHGKSSFFIASYTYYVCLVISAVAIAVSCVGYLEYFIPWLKETPIHTFVGVISILIITMFANVKGAKITGQISTITVWGIIIPVLGLSIIGWFWFDAKVFEEAWNPHDISAGSAIYSGMALTLWAFLGIESAGANSGTVENPKRNVPLACMLATVFSAATYIASTTVIQGIIPNEVLAKSDSPFGLVFAQMFSPLVGEIITAMAIMACLGSLLGWQFTNAQVSKVAADMRLFPKIFGDVNKYDAPFKGMMIMLAFELILAIMTISPTLLKQFNVLVNLAVFINMVPYVLALTALGIIMKNADVNQKEYNNGIIIGSVAVLYSIYGAYSTGEVAVFYGAIITLLGYFFYGFIASREAVNNKVSS